MTRTHARTRPRRRLKLILLVGCALGLAVALSAYGLRGYAAYFHTPTAIVQGQLDPARLIRVGGMVKTGSIQSDPSTSHVTFVITDNQTDLTVTYDGDLPDLFRDNQGVVIEGHPAATPDKPFQATRVLAKHDQYYMPKEAERAMRGPRPTP